METLNLNVNVENITDEEREMLMKLVKKCSENKNKVWMPKYGEHYWFVEGSKVFDGLWCNQQYDKDRYAYGEIFKTKEEAEEEAVRRKMIAKWKMLSIEAGEDENEWNNINRHWAVRYSYENQDVEIIYVTYNRHSDFYFPSWDSISNAVYTLGKDNIKKYILGVKD